MNGPASHIIEYKGYTVTCQYGIYRVVGLVGVKFKDLAACKARIDEIAGPEDNNVSTIYQRKSNK